MSQQGVSHTLSKLMFSLFGLSYPFWTIGCALGAGLFPTLKTSLLVFNRNQCNANNIDL